MKNIALSALALAAIAVAPLAQAGDAAAGAELATKKYACVSCHGEGMNKPVDPSYPKLAGQYPEYIEQALVAYQKGTSTTGRGNAIMASQAKPLSRKEIADIAAYIYSLQGDLQVGHR